MILRAADGSPSTADIRCHRAATAGGSAVPGASGGTTAATAGHRAARGTARRRGDAGGGGTVEAALGEQPLSGGEDPFTRRKVIANARLFSHESAPSPDQILWSMAKPSGTIRSSGVRSRTEDLPRPSRVSLTPWRRISSTLVTPRSPLAAMPHR